MSKIDLNDCTFMIPVFIDSEDRKRNLKIIINYLLKHFNTNIIISEQGTQALVDKVLDEEFEGKYTLLLYNKELDYFHKNKLLNIMIKKANTPYVISYDSDVVFYSKQYVNAINSLRNNESDFCFPFDGVNHKMYENTINLFNKTLDLQTVEFNCKPYHWKSPPGGCLFINKEKFRQCGYENENFKSWGEEDLERLERITKLGYRLKRTPGKLFHLEHSRTEKSTNENKYSKDNYEEYIKITKMSKNQILDYIKEWIK